MATVKNPLVTCAAVLAVGSACNRSSPPPPVPPLTTETKSVKVAPVPSIPAPERIVSVLKTVDETPGLQNTGAEDKAYVEMRKAVLDVWRKAWLSNDPAAQLFGPGADMAWMTSPRVQRRDVDGIREYTWQLTTGAGSGESAKYLASFSKIEDLQLAVIKFESTPSGAVAKVRFDLRGRLSNGGLRHDRGLLQVSAVHPPDGTWKIAEMKPLGLESLETDSSRTPRFTDATASLGLDKVPAEERTEGLGRGSYAVTTGDFDDDGQVDLLVGSSGPVKLYRNTGKEFVDATSAAGLRGETLVTSAAFVDLDNDGLKDLLLLRFNEKQAAAKPEAAKPASAVGPTSSAKPGGAVQTPIPAPGAAPAEPAKAAAVPPASEGDLVAYRNTGKGKFEYKGDVTVRSHHYDRAMSLAVADFDGNGTLDVYIGFPTGRDFTNSLARVAEALPTDVVKQGLWLNDGQWKFTEATEPGGPGMSVPVFPHAAIASDLNADGKPDLFVVSDSGAPSPLYRNDGKGVFSDVTQEANLAASGWSMGAAVGDFDGDGLQDLAVADFKLTDSERLTQAAGKPPKSALLPRASGVTVYRNKGGGKFEELPQKAGLSWAGDAITGVTWVDYNGDGLLDLFITNGLWSGGAEDTGGFFSRMAAAREVRGPMNPDAAMSRPGDGQELNPMLSILRDFKGELSNPSSTPAAKPTLSLGGYQHKRLFRNNGDGTFTDVAFLEAADRVEDGFSVAVTDFDHDGAPDLILRNADRTPIVNAAPVVVLRNSRPANALQVAVKGAGSNRDGIGALITITAGGKKQTREVQAVSGTVQGDVAALFGLGANTVVEKLEVKWPSGKTESVTNVKPGRVLLTEGQGISVQGAFASAPPAPPAKTK